MASVALSRAAKPLSILLLCAPFLLVLKAQAVLADVAARSAVASLLLVTSPLAAEKAPAPAPEVEPSLEATSSPDTAAGAGKARPRASRGRSATAPGAVFVSAANVLRLSKSGAQPTGTFVPKTADHPAGIRLVGVSALGIGVQDGDILVDALGIPARARGEIIGAIIEARARRAPSLSGTLWRAGHSFTITVEQPYGGPA